MLFSGLLSDVSFNLSAEWVFFGCIHTAWAFGFLPGVPCRSALCAAVACQHTPGASATWGPSTKGVTEHGQKLCHSAHWHISVYGQLGHCPRMQN